jgi:NAD(P)H-dependent FMN reductase
VGLGGSIASSSRSRAALEVALEGAAGAGAATQLLDLRELDLPMFDPEEGELTPQKPSTSRTGSPEVDQIRRRGDLPSVLPKGADLK